MQQSKILSSKILICFNSSITKHWTLLHHNHPHTFHIPLQKDWEQFFAALETLDAGLQEMLCRSLGSQRNNLWEDSISFEFLSVRSPAYLGFIFLLLNFVGGLFSLAREEDNERKHKRERDTHTQTHRSSGYGGRVASVSSHSSRSDGFVTLLPRAWASIWCHCCTFRVLFIVPISPIQGDSHLVCYHEFNQFSNRAAVVFFNSRDAWLRAEDGAGTNEL
jgi:hypothetical protein